MSLFYAIGHNNERLSKKQVDMLCEFVDTKNSLVKEGLVNSLLGIDSPRAIDTLIKFSADKQDHIRDWATFGLAQANKNTKKIRDALWSRVNDKHQDTRLEAIAGLAVRKDMRVKEIMKRELLNDAYGSLLFAAIIDYGDKTFLPLLKAQLKKDLKNQERKEWVDCLKNCIAELENV